MTAFINYQLPNNASRGIFDIAGKLTLDGLAGTTLTEDEEGEKENNEQTSNAFILNHLSFHQKSIEQSVKYNRCNEHH